MKDGLPTAAADALFVPVRTAELASALCARPDLSTDESELFRRFADAVVALFHVEFRGQLERIKEAYSPFDPDAETLPLSDTSESEQDRYQRLFQSF